MNKSSFGYIIYPLFPILLITGPALPDIALVLFILLVIIFRNDLFFQIKQKWIKEISETDTIIDKNSLRYSKWLEEATGKLHKKNVPFMAGTDTPIGYLIPGRSLHIELEVMVESGFSNLEAIKSATVNPAKFFGLDNKEGRIKDGYKADLVILNSNPLDDISTTPDIYGLIKNGEFLSRESLDSLMYKN